MKIQHHERGNQDDSTYYDLNPSKILGIGVNYRAHAMEMGMKIPVEPLFFMKPPSALLSHGGTIVRPLEYDQVHFEGELGVVIGKKLRHVAPDEAMLGILGLVCVNDVTVRDLQEKDGQWTRSKGFDTFCPLGPRIVGGLSPADLGIQTRVNGEIRQDSRTSDLIFSVPQIISHISKVMTLSPGDVITTGTPAGVGNIQPGDRIEVEIEGIGILANDVGSPTSRDFSPAQSE